MPVPFTLPEYQCLEKLIALCAMPYATSEARDVALCVWLAGVLAPYRPDPTMPIKETCCGKHWQPQGTRMIHQMEYEAYDGAARYKPVRHAEGGLGAFRYCKDCPQHPEREHPAPCADQGLREVEARTAAHYRTLSPPMLACIRMAYEQPELFMQHVEAAHHDPAALIERIYPTSAATLEQLWQALHHYWDGKWSVEVK
ncbi:MAG: hypothetical protein EAY65_04555 [Alphaproteobacteria bacterium]|nr:MAG: hypothetical protein EAY65_04555 [Alphaproteobacteria bacterium]